MFATRLARILTAVAAVLLGASILFPLWSVRLTAPQYPEGLGMYIWAHTVTGVNEHELENINGLNHYIGMKRIEPDSIPELRVMRPGIIVMAVLGLAAALYGRRRFMTAWAIALVLAGVVGMADFYRWNYDYGHNLDYENAPIKIPGMSYQPPIFGTKQLLNFTATSLPATGGVLAIAAVGLSLLAIFVGRPKRVGGPDDPVTRGSPTLAARAAVALLVGLGLNGCAERPRDVVVGLDSCAYCRMTIDDPRFGAQVVTSTGKLQTFDAVECLASFLDALPPEATPRRVLVADYEAPGTWVEVERARFIRSARLRSPMGRELAAFSPAAPVAALQERYQGELLTWDQVRLMIAEQESAHGHHREHGTPTRETVPAQDTVVVSPDGPVRTIADGVARVQRNGVVVVRAGVYREPTVIIRQPLTLAGEGQAVIDGEEERELLVIGADSVTVRGMRFVNTGTSQATDRAALRVVESAGCLIEGNSFDRTLFGIYLQKSAACLIRDNHLVGREGSQTVTGNGIHLWASSDVVVERNTIDGHRDGIYFEFVTNGIARDNASTNSRRYGLHFMFSDSCRYERNRFIENESGIAVMYSKRVVIAGNRFERSRGGASYGLLLKEITDSEVTGNTFIDNSIGLHLEGASRNTITDNDFVRNGWAVRILTDAQENTLTGNIFAGNLFDVATNSRRNYSTFAGNWWDRYRGYDLDRNGRGDVAHSPVRLFALLIEQSPAAMVLVRSFIVDLLDVAERVIPALTPETLRDETPLMRKPRAIPS